MEKEERDWLYLKHLQDEIATKLKNNEGIITVERHTDNQILTVVIPKKGKALMQKEQMPHISSPKSK